MCYEIVFLLWLFLLLKSNYHYLRKKHSKKIYYSIIYTLLLELIPLGIIYLIVHNLLPGYVMRKNIIAFILLMLIFLATGLGCYLGSLIKRHGAAYQEAHNMNELPSMDKTLYYRVSIFGDEYAWIVCAVFCVISLLSLLWVLFSGNYGEIIEF